MGGGLKAGCLLRGLKVCDVGALSENLFRETGWRNVRQGTRLQECF